MINVHGHETYLVLQLFYTLLQLAPRLSSIREVEVRVADLRAEKRVLLPQAGLDMFAIDEEVLGDGPQSAERETGARLEAEGGQEASTQHCTVQERPRVTCPLAHGGGERARDMPGDEDIPARLAQREYSLP